MANDFLAGESGRRITARAIAALAHSTMHRNRELIRQWTLLQAMARSRDCTIPKLAADLGVSTRTIRRDLNALQEAGFPIYDDGPNSGSKAWRLETRSLGALARSGLTFSELCALYYSRALIECFAGSHVLADVQSALDKFEAALSPQMKKFLDRLPGVVTAKPRGAKRQDATTYGVIAKLLEAILHQRVVGMRYYSAANRREKDYTIIRIGWCTRRAASICGAWCRPTGSCARSPWNASGASRSWRRRSRRSPSWMPTPSSTRWARIEAQRREPRGSRSASIRGSRPYIRERSWHPSQRLKDRADGSVVLTMDVCDDYTLRSWILSFGRGARVLAPAPLVEWVSEELEEAGRQYGWRRAAAIVRRRRAATAALCVRPPGRELRRVSAARDRPRPKRAPSSAYAVCAAAARLYPRFRQIIAVTSAATQPRYPSSFRRRK